MEAALYSSKAQSAESCKAVWHLVKVGGLPPGWEEYVSAEHGGFLLNTKDPITVYKERILSNSIEFVAFAMRFGPIALNWSIRHKQISCMIVSLEDEAQAESSTSSLKRGRGSYQYCVLWKAAKTLKSIHFTSF